MANEITTIRPGDQPANQTRAQSRVLSAFLNRIDADDGGPPRIERALAPSPEVCHALDSRRSEIVAGLEPCERIDAAEAVLAMFDAWPCVRMDASKSKAVAVTYTDQLRDLPIWAIRAGVFDCQRRAESFPPSAGELRSACEARTLIFREEAAKLSKVLNAEIYDPNRGRADDVKDRVKASARALGVPFRPRHQGPHRAEDERQAAERRLATLDHASRPIEVSSDLIGSLR